MSYTEIYSRLSDWACCPKKPCNNNNKKYRKRQRPSGLVHYACRIFLRHVHHVLVRSAGLRSGSEILNHGRTPVLRVSWNSIGEGQQTLFGYFVI